MLNEAYQQEHGPGSDSGPYFQESGGIFSNTFHHVPVILHNYDSPMQMHRPIFLYIKNKKKKKCAAYKFIPLFLLSLMISQSFDQRETKF